MPFERSSSLGAGSFSTLLSLELSLLLSEQLRPLLRLLLRLLLGLLLRLLLLRLLLLGAKLGLLFVREDFRSQVVVSRPAASAIAKFPGRPHAGSRRQSLPLLAR